MKTITGTAGDDVLHGTVDDEIIEGLAGNDVIDDAGGLIDIRGGDGNDLITSTAWQARGQIDGGTGNDAIVVRHYSAQIDQVTTVIAGAGDDHVTFGAGGNYDDHQIATIDLGVGDDALELESLGMTPRVTLGAGTDRLVLTESYASGPQQVIVTDFVAGDAGDRVDFSGYVGLRGVDLPNDGNPFAGGLSARLVQSGADTLLQFNPFGDGTYFETLIVFRNTDAAAFTDANLGYDLDAPMPPGETVTGTGVGEPLDGTPRNDTIYGLGGDDGIDGRGGDDYLDGGAGNDGLIGNDGNDTLIGGDGDDMIEGGLGTDIIDAGAGDDLIVVVDGLDRIDGGAGHDIVQFAINPDYASDGLTIDLSSFAATHSFVLGGAVAIDIEDVQFVDGTGGDDTISYGASFDYEISLHGYRGNDSLTGGSATDYLDGGDGDDRLYGLDGTDYLDGQSGDDAVDGGAGDDFLTGGIGNDRLSGGVDDDELYLGQGDDTGLGGAGDDAIYSDVGTDTIDAGAGDDRIQLIASAGDTVDGGDGTDTLTLVSDGQFGAVDIDLTDYWSGGAVLSGGAAVTVNGIENLIIAPYDGNDRIVIGDKATQAFTIDALGGDDEIAGGGGGDAIDGGEGDDRLFGNAGNDTIHGDGGGLGYRSQGDDYLDGGAGDDTLFGDEGIDTLLGGAGDDFASGGDGDDVIDGGAGRNELVGGRGDDLFLIGAGLNDDSVFGGEGNDVLRATADGAHLLWKGEPPDVETMSSGGFSDVGLVAGDSNDTIDLSSSSLRLDGAVFLAGGGGDDRIVGNDQNNDLRGDAGNDWIDGSVGADTMRGGAGDDNFVVDQAGDRVIESVGEGHDIVRSMIDYMLGDGDVEGLMLLGSARAGSGNALGNDIHGNDLANQLAGLAGADTLSGAGGDDAIDGGAGNDVAFGDDGEDVLTGGTGNDRLEGGAGEDAIDGGTGDDVLSGGGGNDVIDGGEGRDVTVFEEALSLSHVRLDGESILVDTFSEGTDRLAGVETFRFNDIDYSLADLLAEQTSDFHAVVSDGAAITVSGHGIVFGTEELQDVSVVGVPGLITFDSSFNQGGDRIHLDGNAAAYTVARNGSTIEISNGDTTIELPGGLVGTDLVFDDGVRVLRYDSEGAHFMLGDQAVDSVAVPVTAAAQSPSVIASFDPDATSLSVLSPGAGVTMGGVMTVFGTTDDSHEIIRVDDHAQLTFDPSFNEGGDTIVLPGAATAYIASRDGSTAILEWATGSIAVPLGTTETTLHFDDGDRALYFDAAAGVAKIGNEVIDASPDPLYAASSLAALAPIDHGGESHTLIA